MAIDEALLDEAIVSGNAFLRLYRWNPPALSLGRNESIDLYDQKEIARRGIVVVRRPTGGKAVWHEHELTYAAAAPLRVFGSLRSAYHAIHTRLADALRSLGIEAILATRRLAPPPRPLDRPGACFSVAVGGEILAAGRKIVGSAQVRRRDAFLQHGSVLLDGSQEVVHAVCRDSSGLSGETTLTKVLGRTATFEEVAQAIMGSWGAPFRPSGRPTVARPLWRR